MHFVAMLRGMVDTQSYTSFNHKIALAEEGIAPLHLMCLSVGQISFTIAKHRLLNVQKKIRGLLSSLLWSLGSPRVAPICDNYQKKAWLLHLITGNSLLQRNIYIPATVFHVFSAVLFSLCSIHKAFSICWDYREEQTGILH